MFQRICLTPLGLCILLFALLSGCASDSTKDVFSHANRGENSATISTTEHKTGGNSLNGKGRSKPSLSRDSRSTTPTQRERFRLIDGKVFEENDPVAEVRVSLWMPTTDERTTMTWKRVESTTTSRDGRFAFRTDKGGKFAVTALKPGMALTALEFTLENGFGPKSGRRNLRLDLVPEKNITGRVINKSGHPISGANLHAYPSGYPVSVVGELVVSTDTNGIFHAKNLPQGALTIMVVKGTHPLSVFNATAPDTNVEFQIPDSWPRLSGRLVSKNSDLSRSTTTLRLQASIHHPGFTNNRFLDTSDQHPFDFGEVLPLNHLLFISDSFPEKLVPVSKNYQSGNPYWGLNLDDGVSTTVDFHVTAGKTLRGIALDAITSQPLAGIRLYPDRSAADKKRNFVETTGTGEFQLPHVYRTKSVHVESDSYYLSCPVENGALLAEVDATNTLVLAPKRWIRGRVEAVGNQTVGNVELWINQKDYPYSNRSTIVVDPDGSFQYAAQPHRSYVLSAEAPGYALSDLRSVNLVDEDINEIIITLTTGRTVSGTVVDSHGDPVAGALVDFDLEDDTIFSYQTYEAHTSQNPSPGSDNSIFSSLAGEFRLPGVPQKRGVIVKAQARGFAHPAYYKLAPADLPVSDLRLVLPKTTVLQGSVVDEDGKPLPQVTLDLRQKFNLFNYLNLAITSVSGSFHFSNVPSDTSVSLYIKEENYTDFTRLVSVSDEPVSITLYRTKSQDLLVECQDAEIQTPVTSATIGLHINSQRQTYNEIEPGKYLFQNLTIKDNTVLLAEAEGYMQTHVLLDSDKARDSIRIFLRKESMITGRVVLEHDKSPVPNARIRAYVGRETLTTTNHEGRFQIKVNSGNGLYTVLGPNGEKSGIIQFISPAGQSVDVGDIEIFAERPLKVRVIRNGSGKPVSNTPVVVGLGDEKKSGKTDSQGIFGTNGIPIGHWSVTLSEWNKTVHWSGINLNPEWMITIAVGEGVFRGRLLLNEKPSAGDISGQHASHGSAQVRVASDGKFEFRDLTAGNWHFTASTDDRSQMTKVSINIPEDDSVVEQDITLSSSDNSEVQSAQFWGLVVNEEGKPVARAEVEGTFGENGNIYARSDAEGLFNFLVMSDEYTVTSSHETEGRSEPVILKRTTLTSRNNPLKIHLKRETGKLQCTVLSIVDGLPIEGASVTVKTDGHVIARSESQKNGSTGVSIQNLKPGNYIASVDASGYNSVKRDIIIEEGQTLELTEVLSPGGSVLVHVSDAMGNVVPDAPVTLTPLDGKSLETVRTVKTNTRGMATFEGILFGTYDVHCVGTKGTGSGRFTFNYQSQMAVRLTLDGS